MSWEIQFYAETSGAQPVREWLEGLPKNVQHKVAARIEAWGNMELHSIFRTRLKSKEECVSFG